MINASESIDCIIDEALKRFEFTFGTDIKERRTFNRHVVSILRTIYINDPEYLKKRLFEIIDTGYHAFDLCHYLRVACTAENENRSLTYSEALQIIGGKPLSNGDKIYHFSNIEHPIGFTGHKGMCFTLKDDLQSVLTDSIDEDKKVYSHTCKVLKPKSLWDHDALSFMHLRRDELIAEVLLQGRTSFDPRWYEAKDKGAINVVSVKLV